MAGQPPDRGRDVVVVTGAGGMGVAIARRIGSGRSLLLADASRPQLDRTVDALRDEGYAVRGVLTDVSDRASVDALAAEAAGEGRVAAVVHTAGVAAAQGAAKTILEVNVLGTAHVIDAFEGVAVPGTEADGPSGARMLAMLEASGAGRTGTPAEIADAVAFLTGPESRYITGTDLLVDGGQAAGLRRHRPA